MEEKKNKGNILTIVLVVLLLIAVGVICYLLGSNNANGNNQNNSGNVSEEKENNQNSTIDDDTSITPTTYTPKCNPDNTNYLVDIDETKYNNISEYIQNQSNVQISLSYCDSIETYEMTTYNLTDSEKNNVLNEMKNSTFSIEESGFGGACVPTLKISYERNNNKYYISYWGLFAMTSNDGNIYKILDKSANNNLSEPQYCLYGFKNLSSTLTSIERRLSSN